LLNQRLKRLPIGCWASSSTAMALWNKVYRWQKHKPLRGHDEGPSLSFGGRCEN
jgi:hypothetical protein